MPPKRPHRSLAVRTALYTQRALKRKANHTKQQFHAERRRLKQMAKNEVTAAAKRVGTQLVKQHIYSKVLPRGWYSHHKPSDLVKGELRRTGRKVRGHIKNKIPLIGKVATIVKGIKTTQ